MMRILQTVSCCPQFEAEVKDIFMKKIYSFDSFRAIAMIILFLKHTRLFFLTKGAYFVTFFIILSGFFSVYTAKESAYTDPVKPSTCIKYGVSKIWKFFPLHLIGMLCCVDNFPLFFGEADLGERALAVVLNLFCLQSIVVWNRDFIWAFNGVEWTLSVLFICYMLTPVIIKIIDRICRSCIYNGVCCIAVIYLAELIIVFSGKSWWLMSETNPFFRVLDYSVGCLMAYLCLHSQYWDKKQPSRGAAAQKRRAAATVEEAAALGILLYVFVVITDMIPARYLFSVVYTPVFVFLIYVFGKEEGWISQKLLGKGPLSFMGGFSFEFYMIHNNIVLVYVSRLLRLNYGTWSLTVTAFVITVICSFLCHKLITVPAQKLYKGFLNKK